MSGEGEERASRPCSLLLEAAPEREPLHFDVQLVGAPPEVEQLVNNIKQVAEDFLYHWKTFPIVLPPSRFSGPGNRPSDILCPPPCDDLDTALDAGVEPLPLTPKQLQSIREKGEFEVPSRQFPGQSHVWRVAGWLQRGRERAREELYCTVAGAAALLVVVARDRLIKDTEGSVIAGGKSLLQGLHRLLDLVFGLPSLEARDLDKKIREERSRYLVAELICKPENQEDIAALAAWVSRAMRRAASEKCEGAPRAPPPAPALYTTPQRTQVDLRLYRRSVLRGAAPTLQSLLEREARGWFLHFRERHAALLATQKMPMKDIEEEVRSAAMREYVSRVCNAVRSSEALAALGADIPELLAQQLQASAIVARAEEGVQRKLEATLTSASARIRTSHPILSRAAAWRAERVSSVETKVRTELRWAAMELAAADMQAHKLQQHRYFLLRDLTFLRDREPLLMKELRTAVCPTRRFRWSRIVWRARSWAVVRHHRGRRERVATALAPRPAPPAPRAPRSDPAQPVFLLNRDTASVTDTRWLGWRLLALGHRTWCWSWNIMYMLGVFVPWCSPLSLRTLLCIKPFVPDYELSQVNGTLYPKRSSETQTMWSRLLLLWRHVSKERTRFETAPDTGLLGKGLSRQMNRVWNYGVIGGLGSLALLLGLPLVVALVCAVSVLLAATVPLWVPPLALGLHVTNALVYDVDCPDPEKLNRWFPLLEVLVLRVGVLGVLQILLALVLALVLCPLAAVLWLVGGILWWCLRGAWEACAWRAVLARGARAPSRDSVFATRVRGPTDLPPHYQITCGQALAAVMARAELQALSAWAAEQERAIERPLRDYEHFVKACFGPFSVQIAKNGAYKQLEKECSELSASLRDKVATRRRDLSLPLVDDKRRVRMTAEDLRQAVQACAVELSRINSVGATFWCSRGLEAGDWHALALDALADALGHDALHALPTHVPRATHAGPAERAWTERAQRPPHPPDVLALRDDWGAATPSGVWCSWSGSAVPRVCAPALELSAFSARAAPHPPLPHPAHVALVLHNRESDNPVPLDSELCAEILRSLEDAPDCDDKREDVERYRGGGSSGSSSSSDSPDDEEPEHNDHYCRVSGRAACRWTLTGRGVRLRADLASPEDVTLDAERSHGTSV